MTTQDSRAAWVIAHSAIAAFVDRAAARGAAAFDASEVSRRCQPPIARWRSMPLAARRRFIGIVLAVAAMAHVAVNITAGAPVGWLWLIIPGIVAAIGTLFIAASATPIRT